MRVLITGGSGYIGSRIIERLVARDEVQQVINVDIKAPRTSHDKLRFVERSVTEDMTDLFEPKVDIALHLAWVLNPMRDAEKQRRVCIGGTQRFLDGCAAGTVKHVFFMSSGTAYGAHPDHATPVSEDTPLKWNHHFQYSAEKREGEELCRRFEADRPGTLLQIARPCVVGGPNVSNYIFRAIEKQLNFRVLGHDNQMQLVHEDDCAAAIVAIVDSKLPGAFNIAADGAMKMSEIHKRMKVRALVLPAAVLRTIASQGWDKGWSQVTEAPPEFLNFIIYPWLVSNRRLKEEVGFTFSHTAEDTLASFIKAQAG